MLGALTVLYLALLSMNILNQTQTAVFTLQVHLLLPGDLITRMYLYLLEQALGACDVAVNIAPYFVLSAVSYTFWYFETIYCNSVYSKIEYRLNRF